MKFRYILIILVTLGVSLMQKLNGQLCSSDLSRLVKKTREKYDLPAVAVVIVNSEALVLSEIQGVRLINTQQEATPGDYFHIGSCSKSVLSVIAGKLVDEGKIKWVTPFFELFPELKIDSRSEYSGITLNDLFLCRAGIKAYTSGEEKYPMTDTAKPDQRYEFARYLLKEASSSEYADGKFEFLYSNAGYTLAALMLQRVSMLTYEQLIDHYLSKELGITAHFGFPNTIDPDQPWGHLITKNSVTPFPPDHEYKVPFLIRPAGDLSMSPLAFATFIQLNLRGLRGEDNFLKSATYRYIHYGFNHFSLGVANGKMAGHAYSGTDGSAGTFFCRALLMPESDLAFTIMTNAGSGTARMKAVDWLTMKIAKEHFNWWWKFWI